LTVDFKELPENREELGERAQHIIKSSHVIGPATEFIGRALHESGMLRPGEKWTLTMAMSCGFHAEVEMRVSHLGKCESQEGDDSPKSESAVIFATRSDGVRIPFPAPKLMSFHELKALPEKH
jgi:hypothetical protein